MSLRIGHQGFPLHYFLNSTNLDPGIGNEGNSLNKFIRHQGITCQPSFSKSLLFKFHASWFCMKLYLFPPSHPSDTLLSCSFTFWSPCKIFFTSFVQNIYNCFGFQLLVLYMLIQFIHIGFFINVGALLLLSSFEFMCNKM